MARARGASAEGSLSTSANLVSSVVMSKESHNLGLALLWQGREKEAYDAFYKATWSSEQQEMSYYYLAALKAREQSWDEALELAEKSLVKNGHNVKARGLKAALLRCVGRRKEAGRWVCENLALDPFDYVSRYEQVLLEEDLREALKTMQRLMRGFAEHYLQTARDYAEFGMYDQTLAVLKLCGEEYPMLAYYRGFYLGKLGDAAGRDAAYRQAEAWAPDCCFPNKLEDIAVLQDAGKRNPQGAKAFYYLGCLYYDKLQFDRAQTLWEKSIALDGTFPTARRNLALALYNKRGDAQGAREQLEQAFALDETDARVFLELDQLYKRLGMSVEERLARYEAHQELARERDDATLEFVTLYNLAGRHQEALDAILSHNFRPWEGAEGRVSGQYKLALRSLAGESLRRGRMEEARDRLTQALTYPLCLGEGRLEGTKDNDIHYALGVAYQGLGDDQAACREYRLAQAGDNEPAGVQYYYDQPADMILYKALASAKLGEQDEARLCLDKLERYGRAHLDDTVKNDFFAVSLPDFLIFEDDMGRKNRAHCCYLMGLAALGRGDRDGALSFFAETSALDLGHQGARIYGQLCKKEGEPV